MSCPFLVVPAGLAQYRLYMKRVLYEYQVGISRRCGPRTGLDRARVRVGKRFAGPGSLFLFCGIFALEGHGWRLAVYSLTPLLSPLVRRTHSIMNTLGVQHNPIYQLQRDSWNIPKM